MEPIKRESVPARLGLWDAVSIILGIIIGVGIFKTPSDVFRQVPDPVWALSIWLVAGLFVLAGALCFAELASAYPRSGGEYVYLSRAFGPMTGYLFAWAQLTVIRPGSIGALAYVFADFAVKLWGLEQAAAIWLAVAAIVLLTAINILGVTLGKHTQNLLTAAKVLGLSALIIAGLGWGGSAQAAGEASSSTFASDWFAAAMIYVLWTYAGWHEAAYIAAEVKQPQRNIPRALILGTAIVIGIYLLINLALWSALGVEGAKSPDAAENMIAALWPSYGAQAFSILVMISALGALNGMIFTTARIYTEFGADHRLFQPLSRWSKQTGTPLRALVVQGGICVALVLGVPLLSQQRDKGFEQMVTVTAAAFWAFFLLTGISLFVLRRKDRSMERPFRVPGYPWLPLAFCASCAYMTYGAASHRPGLSLLSLLVLAGGLPFYYWPIKRRRTEKIEEPEPVGTP